MNEVLTSKNNSQIKYARKLLSSSSFRKEEGKFIIEGIRLCGDAVRNGAKIETVFFTEKCYSKFSKILDEIKKISEKDFIVDDSIIKLISDTDTPQGIVCICAQNNKLKKADLLPKIVLLENIQNPSNLGSIFRSCDALGIRDVFILGRSCDVYNPKVLRGSMGAVFRLRFFQEEDSILCIENLKSKGYKIYATVPKENAVSLNEINFGHKSGIIFGNEGNGLEQGTIDACDFNMTIPMCKEAESLNVSVAAGISIWEMLKGGKSDE